MTPGGRRPGRPLPVALPVSLLAAVLAVLTSLGLAAGLAPAAGPALAATAEHAAEAVLTELTSLPAAGGQLVVAGTVRNTGTQELQNGFVRLRLSSSPLESRDQVREVVGGGDAGRNGQEVRDSRQELEDDLAPGAQVPFRMEVPVDDLALRDPGVYLLSVEVRDGFAGTVGMRRTFLPWMPATARVQPTPVAWLWPLVDRPHRDAAGEFTDDALAADIAQQGRLGRLLAAAGAHPDAGVTFAVDPMLADDVARMTEPYDVRAAGAAPARGRGTADATDWLATLSRLAGAAGAQPVVALPYAAPDVPALSRRRLTSDLGTSWEYGTTRISRLLGAPAVRDVGWPPDGLADAATLRALRASGATSVILATDALPPDDEAPYSARARAPGGLDALVSDDGLSGAAAAGPRSAEETILAQQRFLAESAMLSIEQSRGGAPASGRIALVTPPARWAPSADWASFLLRTTTSVPWLRAASVAQLRGAPVPVGEDRTLRYPDAARERELPQTHVAGLGQARRDLRILAAVLAPADRARHRDLEVASWRLGSTALRTATAAQRRAATRNVAAAVAERRDKVRVLPGSVTLGAQVGPIPVTVKNDLDQPVTVRVTLTPRTAALRVRDSAVIVVPPGQSRDVRVTVEAVANGLQLLDARLETQAGARYAPPVVVRVRVAQYGNVGSYVIVAAATVLFGAAAVRLARRAHRRVRPRDADAATTGEPVEHGVRP